MKYDPERHHRRSLRLPGHDYASSGAYFVTLVTYERVCWFGEVADAGVNCQVMLSEYGRIAREEWFCTAQRRPNVILHEDEFVVMPNHVHGIIWIMEDEVGAQRRCAPTMHDHNPSLYVAPGSLGAIVRAYKSAVARRINALRKTPGAPMWQRNYYEHIVRSEKELALIQEYIAHNPSRWHEDWENPAAPHRTR